MTMLLTAILYLWLAATILLAATWIFRRQDRRRNDPLDHGGEAPAGTGDHRGADRPVPRPGGDAESHRDTATVAVATGSGPTVLELLDGAVLAHDLTPTTGRISDPDRHAIFLSTTPDAEAIGTAFADELDRLGYTIEPDGLDQARATRGDDVLWLRISPEAGTVPDGDGHRYPTAGPSDVAIEIWTGQDSPPTLS